MQRKNPSKPFKDPRQTISPASGGTFFCPKTLNELSSHNAHLTGTFLIVLL
jgi:hypothetical protein